MIPLWWIVSRAACLLRLADDILIVDYPSVMRLWQWHIHRWCSRVAGNIYRRRVALTFDDFSNLKLDLMLWRGIFGVVIVDYPYVMRLFIAHVPKWGKRNPREVRWLKTWSGLMNLTDSLDSAVNYMLSALQPLVWICCRLIIRGDFDFIWYDTVQNNNCITLNLWCIRRIDLNLLNWKLLSSTVTPEIKPANSSIMTPV